MRRQILDMAEVVSQPQNLRVRTVIRHALRCDQRFNSGWEGIMQAARIEACCATIDEPASVLIDEGDWEKLCETLRNPLPMQGATAYPCFPGLAAIPLIEQVLQAVRESSQ